jgi:hypothetical protein
MQQLRSGHWLIIFPGDSSPIPRCILLWPVGHSLWPFCVLLQGEHSPRLGQGFPNMVGMWGRIWTEAFPQTIFVYVFGLVVDS